MQPASSSQLGSSMGGPLKQTWGQSRMAAKVLGEMGSLRNGCDLKTEEKKIITRLDFGRLFASFWVLCILMRSLSLFEGTYVAFHPSHQQFLKRPQGDPASQVGKKNGWPSGDCAQPILYETNFDPPKSRAAQNPGRGSFKSSRDAVHPPGCALSRGNLSF